MPKLDILSLNKAELTDFLTESGYPSFRANQVFSWLQKGVQSFDEMNNITLNLRSFLEENCYIASAEIEVKRVSRIDGTVKYLFRLFDGEYIESVLMKYKYGYSLCISTQVGCRMGCKFCATGLSGLKRNLTASEMLSQVLSAKNDMGVRISHIVMMGMGEPLDNYDNSIKFLKLVSSEDGLNLSPRNISLSTCGVVDKINSLADLKIPITLSVSLHAPNDKLRKTIMPINNKWNVDELLKACKNYINVTKRRISFEYALIENVNDTENSAKELAQKLKGMLCHVNLIPANPVKENGFKKPDRKRQEHFMNLLTKSGINATIRRTLGSDIDASCGQLRGEHTKDEVAKKLRIASKTDKGIVRSNNQDSFVAGPIGEDSAWAVVCDGMGGVNGGNIASSIAVKAVSDSVISSFRTNMSSNSIRNLFDSAFNAANVKILNRAREEKDLQGMGTTAVAAVVCNGMLYVFHIGDSRAYLIRDGEISRITRDHSIIQSMIEQGEITLEQAKNHPSKNIITKALGTVERVSPDYNEIDFYPNDILLICSDGLTNYAEEQTIKQIVLENEFSQVPEKLVEEANKNGGGDNITAVLLSY